MGTMDMCGGSGGRRRDWGIEWGQARGIRLFLRHIWKKIIVIRGDKGTVSAK